MAETKKAKKHIVVFQDEEGNVLKTSFVSHEEAALPPEMPEKRGESVHHEIKFQGWDKDISSVKENLVVKAVYKEVPKEYLVMYFHENGKMLGTETVPYRQAATQPYRPQKPQTEEYYYIFKGWNNDLSHIEKDTMAKAVFEERQRSFVVRFFHENGTLLKEENVQPYVFSAEELAEVEKIKRERYDKWEWNYGFSPSYSVEKSRRFEGCGKIEVHMNTEDGSITDLQFFGDFFGVKDSADLAKALIGTKLERQALESRLADFDIAQYFHGLEKNDFLNLLLQSE